MKKDLVPLMLRLPRKLKLDLTRSAKRQEVSLNEEVNNRLRLSVDAPPFAASLASMVSHDIREQVYALRMDMARLRGDIKRRRARERAWERKHETDMHPVRAADRGGDAVREQ